MIQRFGDSKDLHNWAESCCYFVGLGANVRENYSSGDLMGVAQDFCILVTDESRKRPILISESISLFFSECIKTLPILGTLVGIGRMCAVWGVKGAKDSICLKIYHTFVAILEILGLGILMLILKILAVILVSPLLCFSSSRSFLYEKDLMLDKDSDWVQGKFIIKRFECSEFSEWLDSTSYPLGMGALLGCAEDIESIGGSFSLLETSSNDPTIPISTCKEVLVAYLISSLPIGSTLVGIGRMCAIWGVKDIQQSIGLKIYHTFVAILEILGLGILMLILRILLLILVTPLLCFSSGRAFLVKCKLIITFEPKPET
ncbi:hypothetical protein C10C_0799 [Chlamydia serpentis]|uniref:Uncharacterized protein n=1 Tax=Chlamydia serpentis TaxID=1967782 RepID=A0A2R8FC87_9CHLA|nr:hypothetical protein [Chlamydia serpentis]SPN73942.1 hypothetical protein C10C_0799 [Chlamydia serpentis]